MASGSTDTGAQNQSQKREVYLKWEDYFMSVALVAGQRSKDPKSQVGACIVNEENKIIGIGYNGAPEGNNDDELPWGSDEKHSFVVHAEENAIEYSSGNLKNSTMYVSLHPCDRCAKEIIKEKIKNIVYLSDEKAHKPEFKESKVLLKKAGIETKQFQSSLKGMEIDFSKLNQKIR